MCAYRGVNNLRCAAGCLIADDEYKHEMEKKSWSILEQTGYVPTTDKELLISKLQDMHDNSDVSDWVEELAEIADDEGLDFKLEEYTA